MPKRTLRSDTAARRKPAIRTLLVLLPITLVSSACTRRSSAVIGARAVDAPDALDAAAAAQASSTADAAETQVKLHCFSWVHLKNSSENCYRTSEACEDARTKVQDGSRQTIPCRTQLDGACTRLYGGKDQRCFGGYGQCERYRAFVRRNGIKTSPCEAAKAE
jgi:hypothetical protein